MDLISVRELARRKGVTHHAVQKRIASGSLSTVKGKIDPLIADREWDANRDISKVRDRTSSTEPAVSPEPKADPRTPERTFADAKTKREYVRLEKEALYLKQQKGELAHIGPLNNWATGMIAEAKQILLRIGPELKDRLAQETSPHACEVLITAEVHRALSKLSEYRPNAA
jgi:hypothetical protein